MVSTSNDGIMTEYLVKYGAIRASAKDRPSELLETLYMTDCYRAGRDLQAARKEYDTGIWNDAPNTGDQALIAADTSRIRQYDFMENVYFVTYLANSAKKAARPMNTPSRVGPGS